MDSPSGSLQPARSRASRRALWTLVVVALAVRMAVMFGLDTPAGIAGKVPWTWACEQSCIADSILRGDGFGDPFAQGSGPSAWLTPVYPYLVAGLMWALGGMSSATALVLYLIQAVVSALTAAGVVILGQRVIDRRAGLAAGWIWALHPTAIWYSVGHVWDTSLTAGALVGFLILFLAWGRRCSPVRSLGSGSLFGLLLLLSPAPIGILPVLLIYLAPAGDRAPSVRRVLLFLLGMGLACLPWMLRNHSQVGTLGLRSNLMVELRVGNNELANGWHQKSLHPGWSPEEGAELKRLGEPLYAERCGELALDWIRSHPDLFLELCAVRFTLIWFGAPPTLDPRSQGGMDAARDPRSWLRWITFMLTGVIGVLGLYSTKRRGPDAVLLLATVLLFVVPYYVTHSLERYRFPIEPLLILGCGVALASASRAWLRRPREPQADAGPSG